MLDFSWGIFDGTLSSTGVPTGSAITASRTSTQVLDILSNPSTPNVIRNLGAGPVIGLHVDVTTTFLTLTSLQVEFDVSPDNSTWYQIALSPVYPAVDLIAGASIFRYALPSSQQGLNWAAGINKISPRYLRLNYTVAGSNATAGAVFAYLSPLLDRNQFEAITANYSVGVAAGEI